MKILICYAGIGGNRKLWGESHEITAVELNEDVAKIYQDLFPNDKVVVADAHKYLLQHYKEFDFIWSSPPCPTHSRTNHFLKAQKEIDYPDMQLYQEIIFLKHFFKGKFAIENVIPYYKPLIYPTVEIHRHFFWSNFPIYKVNLKEDRVIKDVQGNSIIYGFNLKNYKIANKRQILRNLVNPKIGKYILNTAMNIQETKQIGLFAETI